MSLTSFALQTENKEFDLSHGFLPPKDPIEKLSEPLAEWESLAFELPKLLTSDQTRKTINNLPSFDLTALNAPEDYERAMLILSYLGHAYVWNNEEPIDHIPAVLAKPWFHVAKTLGRPPVLSYASYALYNWRRLDTQKPIELGNIVLLQNFLGGIDEEWFILIHVDIEAKAARGLNLFIPAQQAVNQKDTEKLFHYLNTIVTSLSGMCDVLKRMPEHCDPYIYYNRVRPYIHGWKDNPALPNGLIYEGVDAYQGKGQFFKGETGAQSTIIPSYDALLGIEHEDNPLKTHLDEMQLYMPPQHRQFLAALKQGPSLRKYIIDNHKKENKLKTLYNECIKLVSLFRQTHLGYAARYIQKQHQTSLANPTAVGTGGTPFMKYLSKHLNETENFLI